MNSTSRDETVELVIDNFLRNNFLGRLENLSVRGAGWDSQSMVGLVTPFDLYQDGEGAVEQFGYFEFYCGDDEKQLPIDSFRKEVETAISLYTPKNDTEDMQLSKLSTEFDNYIRNLQKAHEAWKRQSNGESV